MKIKIANILMLLSCLYSAYVLVYVIYLEVPYFIKYRPDIIYYFTDWLCLIVFWVPILSSIISIVFMIMGINANLKLRNWWWALAGAVFMILVPIVWPQTNYELSLAIRFIDCLLFSFGIVTIIITLFSRKDFKQSINTFGENNRLK